MTTEPANFIDNYRIVSKVADSYLSSIYLAVQSSVSTTPVLVTHWHSIRFTTDDDAQTFLKKARHGIIFKNSQRIPLLDAQIYHQSPYIVTASNAPVSAALESHTQFIDHVIANRRVLHPNDPHSSIEAFLYIFCTSSNTNPFVHTNTSTTSKKVSLTVPRIKMSLPPWKPQLLSRRTYIAASIVLLLLLLIGGTALLTNVLPASAATVTITPLSTRITRIYTITLVTGAPGANQVKEHTISYTTPPQSQTVPATGMGHHDATHAQGQVMISQIHFFNHKINNSSASPGDIQASDGTIITIDSFTATEGGSVTVNASANPAGQSGNISANDINGRYNIYQSDQSNSSIPIGIANIQNTDAFTGGQDASDYTYVQQQDIDGATNPLIAQLTPTAQQQAQQQLQPDEQLVKNITCSNNVNSDHQVQDITKLVTVTVQATCNGIAYNKQDLLTAASNAQKADEIAQYGTTYQLSGDITTGTPNLNTSSQDGAIVYEVPTDGIWVFQIDKAQQQELAHTIAGHRQQDATNQLLEHKGIKSVLITVTSSIGTLLPSSPDNIKFTIVQVPGLAPH